MFATSERADIYMAGVVYWWHVENYSIVVDFVVCAHIHIFVSLANYWLGNTIVQVIC